MKKKIYVTLAGPSETEMKSIIASFRPALSDSTSQQTLSAYEAIKKRLQNSVIDNPNFSFNQTQTISDGKHTITLVGRPDEPSRFQKFIDFF
jgi:hypothetical protein